MCILLIGYQRCMYIPSCIQLSWIKHSIRMNTRNTNRIVFECSYIQSSLNTSVPTLRREPSARYVGRQTLSRLCAELRGSIVGGGAYPPPPIAASCIASHLSVFLVPISLSKGKGRRAPYYFLTPYLDRPIINFPPRGSSDYTVPSLTATARNQLLKR